MGKIMARMRQLAAHAGDHMGKGFGNESNLTVMKG